MKLLKNNMCFTTDCHPVHLRHMNWHCNEAIVVISTNDMIAVHHWTEYLGSCPFWSSHIFKILKVMLLHKHTLVDCHLCN